MPWSPSPLALGRVLDILHPKLPGLEDTESSFGQLFRSLCGSRLPQASLVVLALKSLVKALNHLHHSLAIVWAELGDLVSAGLAEAGPVLCSALLGLGKVCLRHHVFAKGLEAVSTFLDLVILTKVLSHAADYGAGIL